METNQLIPFFNTAYYLKKGKFLKIEMQLPKKKQLEIIMSSIFVGGICSLIIFISILAFKIDTGLSNTIIITIFFICSFSLYISLDNINNKNISFIDKFKKGELEGADLIHYYERDNIIREAIWLYNEYQIVKDEISEKDFLIKVIESQPQSKKAEIYKKYNLNNKENNTKEEK